MNIPHHQAAELHYFAAWRADGVRQDSLRRAGIMKVMSKSSSRRFPVTVTQLPVTRCQICRRAVAYRPGNLSEV
jgi:hypothetical protein